MKRESEKKERKEETAKTNGAEIYKYVGYRKEHGSCG